MGVSEDKGVPLKGILKGFPKGIYKGSRKGLGFRGCPKGPKDAIIRCLGLG